MKITLFEIADYASPTPGGGMNIIGTFNNINAASIPFDQFLSVVVKWEADFRTIPPQGSSVTIAISGPDGQLVASNSQPIPPMSTLDFDTKMEAALISRVVAKVHAYGKYKVILSMGDTVQAEKTFTVSPVGT